MATWGLGVFDDDLAMDWVDQVLESEDAPAMFESIFVYALDTNYVSHEDSCAVTASCAIIDSLVNGTVYPMESQDLKEWLKDNSDLEVEGLCQLGARALDVIMSKKSELNELWQESGAEYGDWKLRIKNLQNRIKSKKKN